jgi:predicted RNA-binding protein associated with RNAse of E/G family
MFTAEVVTAGEDLIAMMMVLERERPLVVRGKEAIADGARVIWFLQKDEGWDIAAVYRPDGSFSGYYVDVLDPVYWEDANAATLLPIVDLFLDVWIDAEGWFEVLDRDEFEEASEKGWITEGQQNHARRVLAELEEGIAAGTFPPPEVRQIAAQ